MEACIVGRARSWRVPASNAGACAVIELPFRIGSSAVGAGLP